jgi:hypothetical protein
VKDLVEKVEKDRKMTAAIEAAREKRDRGERLTEQEWKLISFGSQACHCGQRMV